MFRVFCLILLSFSLAQAAAAEIPEWFPRFVVPGHEAEMERVREMFLLHYGPATLPVATMWDEWLPMSSLWSVGPATPETSPARSRWRHALLNRRISGEGYVSTHQHRGLAHNEGWPFPMWTQTGGIGWSFSLAGQLYGAEFGIHRVTNVDNWELDAAKTLALENDRGWSLELSATDASITTHLFNIDPQVSPFIRLAWRASGLRPSDQPYLEWTTAEQPEFSPVRRMYFSPIAESDDLVFTHIPVHRSAEWRGRITRLRVNFGNQPGAKLGIVSLITAADSRHNINNSRYIAGCCDYAHWTGDLAFLRANIQRMRLALHYMMDEFGTREHKCVVTPWVGHGGRSAIQFGPDGKKIIHHGQGIGNNYFDLVPFGGQDAFATIYYYDAVRRMAELERQIAAHSEWNISGGPLRFDPDDLSRHAREVKQYAGALFWSEATGRFIGAIDVDGNRHDYGFTPVNCEAVYYDFATEDQARSIMDWLSGRRIVTSDTSQGKDIYRWRFAPRISTLRNTTYYMEGWQNAEDIPFGYQIQDGGAVLGFSYHDLMARLATNGPDDAWARLSEILAWFAEVQAEGGYRAYYKDPARGTLQGGGPPGGLGMDREFMESVLVPQVMLYGFLGFEPRLDGFAIEPKLPADWPELSIGPIHFHDLVLSVTASEKTIRLVTEGKPRGPLSVFLAPGKWSAQSVNAEGQPIGNPVPYHVEANGRGIPLVLDTTQALEFTRQ